MSAAPKRARRDLRFELVVFDWDGTLMDSTAVIASSIQRACVDLGLPVPSDQRASHVIGLGLADALAYAVPELPRARFPEMIERYRHHYLSRDADLPLFPGVEDMLVALRQAGHFVAVATGKSRVGLDRALDTTGLRPLFDATRCADECRSKPDPAMLFELGDELGVRNARMLMIGDTTHDLLMAANAGAASVGVGYGAHPAHALEGHGALAIVATSQELVRGSPPASERAMLNDDNLIPVCAAEALVDGGVGCRFPVLTGGRPATGFAIRFDGQVHGYLNRCTHAGIELDWEKGRFFESSGRLLMCATHGAVYRPDDGRCAGGPCRGGTLRRIVVLERDGQIFWQPDTVVMASDAASA